ncbi:MAG TPA: SigB/SigF/SigG family RNA polymerase sigma factor [Pilimelia sp.]|nr:SigB/SigF/SigG family RNA polymerase sigma factor [Pilimelia sp.]
MAALPVSHPSRPHVRERAIRAWLPMAHRLAQRYAHRGEPTDDLRQVATVGLIKAIDRYEPQRGGVFAGYAVPTILGEIKRYFRDRTWSVRVPRRLQDLRMAINEATTALVSQLNRAPTVADVAAYLQVTEEQVVEGLDGARAYHATSLCAPATADGTLQLGDTLGADEHGYELVDLRIALGPALATLDERERRILSLRFYGNQTQTQIAEQIGVSQMHVSRLISKALAKLRTHLGPEAA